MHKTGAHVSGFISSWFNLADGFNTKPWIFPSEVLMNSGIGKVFGICWLIACIGFIAVGVGIIAKTEWWINYVVISSSFSVLAILPFINSVPFGAKIGMIFSLGLFIVFQSSIKEKLVQFIVSH